MIKNSHVFINDLDKLKYNKICLITGREFTEEDCKRKNIRAMIDDNKAIMQIMSRAAEKVIGAPILVDRKIIRKQRIIYK